MRAFVAILILSTCLCLHARSRDLQSLKNILRCGIALGPSKCLNALTAWRAERAFTRDVTSDLKTDLEQFPWQKYNNSTDEELYSEACDGTEKLLRKQTLSLTMIPGLRVELLSKGNGTLGVDIYKNAAESARSSVKKAKKAFLQIFPFLVLPGLIIAAILPFFLPALKFMTLGAGMLNNMALSGAIFTLLRNNAFDDHYEHKVIYVNKGYKNEHLKHVHNDGDIHSTDDHYYIQDPDTKPGFDVHEIETIEEVPINQNWDNNYNGDVHKVQYLDDGSTIHNYRNRVSKSIPKT